MSTQSQILANQAKAAVATSATNLEDFRVRFQPTDCHEFFLVQTMADASWRLQRLKHWELDIVALCDTTNPFLDEELFKKLNRAHRHIQSIERSYHRALTQLNAARKSAAPKQTQIPVPTPERERRVADPTPSTNRDRPATDTPILISQPAGTTNPDNQS